MTADRHVTLEEVLAYIARLPERQSEAARLVWVERRTLRDAARRMGVTHQRVADLLAAARENLRHDVKLNTSPESA